VGTTAELEEDGTRLIAEVDGVEIAVFRLEDDYHAVVNFCVHQGGPLCEGKLRGRTLPGDDGWSWKYDDEEKYVTCPWHAWKFDITTGECIDSDHYSVPIYDVEIEDGDIYVSR
jgi:nitrite reductase/ring-hydroxylating ferredoxin subunit